MANIQNIRAEKEINELLKRRNLSITGNRTQILSLFLQSTDALAHSDIESKAGEKMDRVTIYRTLQTFVEKGIVHTIPTTDNNVSYALCKDCKEQHHKDDHVHFICERCDTVTCLDNVVSPQVALPEHYIISSVQVVINGICTACQH